LKSAERSKESLEPEESAHGLPTGTQATVSEAGLSPSPPESTSSHEHLGNKTVGEDDDTFDRREIRENETDTKIESSSGKDVSVVRTGVEQTQPSAQPLKTNVTAESQTVSSSLRKRRLSTATRQETQASPLPIAAALTMSESLYNHFHPLDDDVPEDHRLPFLNFGKKLVPVSSKATSPVASPSSTRSTDSFEAVSTPPVGQYNLLSTPPQRILSANSPLVHIPREDEIHEDMDVSVMKSVVENKAPRNRGSSPQSLRKLGGLYRKQETSTADVAENASTASTAQDASTENSALKTEQRTSNNSESDRNIRMKLGSLHNASTASPAEMLPISKGTQRNHPTTDHPNTSINDHPEVTSYLSTNHKYRSETTQNSETSKPKAVSPTSRSAVPTQLSASSSRVEATVSTPSARSRPSLPIRNATSFAVPNRRPPQGYQHSYRQPSALSKSSKPPERLSKSSNISVENEISLTNTSLATNSNEMSTESTSSVPLQVKSAFPKSHTGRKDFTDGGGTKGDESRRYVSDLMNSGEKLIADPNERNTKREPLTKSNATLSEDTVNNFGRNITSQLSIESVTTKLIASTSPLSGDTNATIPTEVSFITTPIQSPTTKILSTAVVTSVSVEGAWPMLVTDTPALEQTLVPPQIFASQMNNEHLEQPARYGANRTQSFVNGNITAQTRDINTSADRSVSRELPGNMSYGGNSTVTSKGGNFASDKSSSGNSTVTSSTKEGTGVSRTQKFTPALKDITSNITEAPHIDTANGQSNRTSIPINKINTDQTSESIEPVVGRGTVRTMKDAKTPGAATTRNPDVTLKDSRNNGVAYPVTSPAGTSKPQTPKPAGRNSRNRNGSPRTQTRPQHSTKSGTLSAPSEGTNRPPATDAGFDFPLLKLYNASTVWSVPERGVTDNASTVWSVPERGVTDNASTVWSVPERGVTESPGEASKSPSEYPSTGNGTTHSSEADVNIMEAATRKGAMADEVTEAEDSVHTTADISGGESGKVAAGKDGQEGMRPSTEAGLTNNSVSNGGVNPLLGVGNDATTASPLPGESVAMTQGVSIAVYVISALGVLPLAIGIALTARYCVRRRRKVSST
jgi:hypothetical protein